MKRDYLYLITKIISNILLIVLSFIILICVYSFICLSVLNHKYVNLFSYSVFSIGSNSMAPFITTNDLILVKLTDDVNVGDVITFQEDDVLITHRIISSNAKGFVTKGDANNTEDKSVSKDMIVGKVVHVFTNYGVWFKVITTPKIICLICVTLFMFSLAFSYTGKKHLSKNDDFGIYYSGIKEKEDKNDK